MNAPWSRGIPTTIVAATYNVHGLRGRDGVRDPDRVARVLRALHADLVAVQEVPLETGDPDDELGARVGLRSIEDVTLRRPDGTAQGNLLLTSGSILAVRRVDLGLPGREPRGAIDATLRVGRPPCDVRCVVTHLGLSARERLRQARLLAAHVARTPVEAPTILAGDFNVWNPGSRALAVLRRSFGTDTRCRTFPAVRPTFALDRVFAGWPARFTDVSTVTAAGARDASDHLPLRATLAIGDARRAQRSSMASGAQVSRNSPNRPTS